MTRTSMKNSTIAGTLATAGVLVSALALALAAGGCGSSGKVAAAAKTPEPVPTVDAVRVISQKLRLNISLPGELQPYEEVRIFPKVTGFVQWIGVDRGSRVKQGQLLATLVAPELVSQKAEAQAKLLSAESQRIAGEAKLSADESTFQRLKKAAATPGVISDEELEIAEKTADADRARVVALRNTRDAARATLRSFEQVESYLRITAPFDGVVTKRNVHPGALVGPSAGAGSQSMLRIEQVSHLRLVVAVPEAYVAGIEPGAKVPFTVPAFPGRVFTGVVARLAESMDPATRTMPVEMDVWNPDWALHSGMFPEVDWPVRRQNASLFVPQSSVGRNAEATYVVRIENGKAEWAAVKTGATEGNLTEVFGDLKPGDQVTLHAGEELRPGAQVMARLANDDSVGSR